MSDWIMWPVVAVALFATYLANEKNKWCWPMWLCTNIITGVHLAYYGDGPLVAKQAAFFALSVRGMWLWWRPVKTVKVLPWFWPGRGMSTEPDVADDPALPVLLAENEEIVHDAAAYLSILSWNKDYIPAFNDQEHRRLLCAVGRVMLEIMVERGEAG